MQQGVGGPCRCLVGVADIAGVRDFQALGSRRRRRNGRCGCGRSRRRLSARFSACGRRRIGCRGCPRRDGCAARCVAACGPFCVFGPWQVRHMRGAGLPQHRVIVGAVRIVAAETGDAARVHQALHEIVALHAVLVRGAVGKMGEGGFAELVLLQLPEVVAGCSPRGSRPASRSIFPRSDSSAAAPASGTGCRCRWPAHSRGAPD